MAERSSSRSTIILAALTLLCLVIGYKAGMFDWLIKGRGTPVEPIDEIHDVTFEALPVASVGKGDWPWWRGPARDNRSSDAHTPGAWSEEQNVIWKSPVPGRGHSSPIVVGTRVFLTSADDDAKSQSLLAFDARSGKQLWSTPLHVGQLVASMHPDGSQADATPACDGERVFTSFWTTDGLQVSACDLDGKKLWQTRAGPYESRFGFGSSPVIYKSFVIVCADDSARGFVAALHRKTGAIIWRVRRPKTVNGSHATPIIHAVNGRDQLLLGGSFHIQAFDPDNGALLWSVDTPKIECMCNTMAHGDNLVFASGGTPAKATLCLRADIEAGEQRQVWSSERASETAYVPSLLAFNGLLFVLNDNGIMTCFDAATGKKHWRERLRGAFFASPAESGGRLYVCGKTGETTVLEAAPEFKVLARNKLQAGIFATPALCRDRVYIRTLDHLYCIGLPTGPDAVPE